MYPFDKEECTIQFECSGEGCEFVNIYPGYLEVCPESFDQYEVLKDSDEYIKRDGNILEIKIVLVRNIGSIFLVTYLPTILMNIINQSTNYVEFSAKCEFIITVNITCMMVLASLYISVSNSLPLTAAIKPVEIWLLFNLGYPFLVIIINIIIQVAKLLLS